MDSCVPKMETCNGTDDDCDKVIDNGFQIGTACDSSDADQCTAGTWACDGAGGRSCQDDVNRVEVCNDNDDDCDGLVDEDFAKGEPCDVDAGSACMDGFKGCVNESFGCVDNVHHGFEDLCTSADDNCNGSFVAEVVGTLVPTKNPHPVSLQRHPRGFAVVASSAPTGYFGHMLFVSVDAMGGSPQTTTMVSDAINARIAYAARANVYGLAYDGLVAPTNTSSHAMFAIVSPSGQMVTAPVDLMPGATNPSSPATVPSVAYDATLDRFAVLFVSDTCDEASSKHRQACMVLLRTDGTIEPGSMTNVTKSAVHVSSLVLSSAGNRAFAVAYSYYASLSRLAAQVATFSSPSAPADTLAQPITLDSGASDASYPALAWSGTRWGVTWQQRITTTTDFMTRFAWLTPQGASAASVEISSSMQAQRAQPALVWAANHFMALYPMKVGDTWKMHFSTVRVSGAGVGEIVKVEQLVTDVPTIQSLGAIGVQADVSGGVLLSFVSAPPYSVQLARFGCSMPGY